MLAPLGNVRWVASLLMGRTASVAGKRAQCLETTLSSRDLLKPWAVGEPVHFYEWGAPARKELGRN
jgi:hypothetical protein